MANQKHVQILQRGVQEWYEWRQKNPGIKPNLSKADLSRLQLGDADFEGVNLSFAQLVNAKLSRAHLKNANLHGADLQGANLTGADLTGANLSTASLIDTNLCRARVQNANFNQAVICFTVFASVDLSEAKELETIVAIGPFTIGLDTICKSEGKIPDKFLRDAGTVEEVITNLLPTIRAGLPIQWHSCFISYSTKNQVFADRLHSRMRQAGLQVWLDREDMKGGDYIHTQIDRAIQLHDRLLLVLSEESIQSKWVEREIKRARKVERAENRRKLFPIRLTDMKTLREWECLDSDTGEDLAEEVRKYHIPDFSNWKNHDAFEAAFARLEKDLRASVSR